MGELQVKVEEIRNAMFKAFAGRATEAHVLILALLAREHVVMIGPPGTAKSAIAKAACTAFGGRYFRLLLTRFSTPEEIFGPVSLSGLEHDCYRRVPTGRLPEADVVTLEEIFKANSAILNSLLLALCEREWDNGGTTHKLPLRSCLGTSNELPESESELAALWDRFIFRLAVEELKDADNIASVLLGVASGKYDGPVLSPEEVSRIDEEISQIPITPKVAGMAMKFQHALLEAGVTASMRRWKQVVLAARAAAWVYGHDEVLPSDLAEVAKHALWSRPEEKASVIGIIQRIAYPELAEAREIGDAAEEEYRKVAALVPEDGWSSGVQPAVSGRFVAEASATGMRMKTQSERLWNLLKKTPCDEIEQIMRKVNEWREWIKSQIISASGM